jgi:hypothetical protein
MRVWTEARTVRTGKVFLVLKVIMEFTAGPSGRENLSVRKGTFRTLILASGISFDSIFFQLSNDADFVLIRYLSKTL